jgi:restriction system protein
MTTDHTNIDAAFEMLLEELETEIDLVNNAGAKAFLAGNYRRVEAAKAQAVKVTEFREQIADLQRQWQDMMASFNPEHGDSGDDELTRATRRDLGRLRRGVRTPEAAYRIPILQTLVEAGGSGTARDILACVEAKMGHVLGEADYEALPSKLVSCIVVFQRTHS